MQRPNMRFVPVKTEDQQARVMVHRAPQGFVVARTACINRIRGLLSEFGIVLPLKAEVVRRDARNQLENLPGFANLVIGDLLSEVAHLDERVKQYDVHVRTMARDCNAAQQLMQLMGIGEVTATAIVAMVGNVQSVLYRTAPSTSHAPGFNGFNSATSTQQPNSRLLKENPNNTKQHS